MNKARIISPVIRETVTPEQMRNITTMKRKIQAQEKTKKPIGKPASVAKEAPAPPLIKTK